MKIFWYPHTRASRISWMAEEAGVDYDLVHIDLKQPDVPRDPDFALASPLGKVPAIDDGGVRMWDSAPICLYIADRYAPGRLAPAIDSDERGEFLFWMFFGASSMEPAMVEKGGGWEPNAGSTGWGSFEKVMTVLESALEAREWVAGGDFSAADVMVGSTARFMQLFGMLPESKAVTDYIARCQERPAFAAAMSHESAPPAS